MIEYVYSTVLVPIPVLVFNCFCFLWLQPWVMLGMSSGDIIKCCIMTDIYSMVSFMTI